ncbi:fibronectin type III domain-containing protein [Campylobacter sp. MG1]|uniref:fibronectin type III domain-containing protein n=1 Tax=Campylobacter sp. MG1 TaxID=2976332 RepID=UPI00226CCD02|nr:ferrous iron transporter A [Campylobacter sp. MG1]
MNNITKASFFTAMIIGFSACSSTTNLSEVRPVDNLTSVTNIKTLQGMKDIGFEWDPIYDTNVSGYKIFRKEVKEDGTIGNDVLIATIKDRYATHFSDNNLKTNTQYIYTFATFNDSGLSTLNQVNVKTKGTISGVTFIQAIAGLPNKIKIIWRPHNDTRVVKYNIYKKDLKSDNWRILATVNNRLSAEYIDTVKPNMYARYKISAVTFNGVESEFSQEVEAISKVLPPQVINIQASSNLPKKIILTWDAPKYNDFAYYRIYSSRASLLPFFELATTHENQYEDLVNDDGVTRYYYITMVDKDGLESQKSNVNVAGMSLAKPKSPIITGFELYGETGLKVKWVNNDNRIKHFKLFKNGTEIANGINGNFFIDSSYVSGDTYQVVGIDEYGIESKASSKLSVK